MPGIAVELEDENLKIIGARGALLFFTEIINEKTRTTHNEEEKLPFNRDADPVKRNCLSPTLFGVAESYHLLTVDGHLILIMPRTKNGSHTPQEHLGGTPVEVELHLFLALVLHNC